MSHLAEKLSSALLELQSALNARSLYPRTHPRIRAVEARAHGLITELTRELPTITVFVVGERIIFDDRPLPASIALSDSLFRVLGRHGVDRLTFRPGIEPGEIHEFLDSLVDERIRVRPSAGIRIGFIRDAVVFSDEVAIQSSPEAPLPAQLAGVLGSVWRDVHLERPLQTDTLGDIFLTITKALSDTSQAVLPLADVKRHDEYTFVHTINVALLSTALGEAVGFRSRLTHELNMAALLHDIGKQLIPLEVLNKTGRFTEEEFELVRRHPVDGARLLLATPGIPEVAPIVAYEHHVRADGSGYPRVPRGWKLSLASRVVQVADVFDALRTHRPYRPALPLDKIIRIMRDDVPAFFDRDLLDVFLSEVVVRGVPEPAAPAETVALPV